ncbi:hypothetical protein EDB85DRAFT_2024330 [Lactarius pseudohatsudake]|nr:hypothetical protein EDB85DRAFT_2024330 [Lactarius pseudohatsudake]
MAARTKARTLELFVVRLHRLGCGIRHAPWFTDTGHTLALQPTTEQDNKTRTRIRASMSCLGSTHYPLYQRPLTSTVPISDPSQSQCRVSKMLLSTGSPSYFSISNLPHSSKSNSSSSATPRGPYKDMTIENIAQSRVTKHGNVHAEAGNRQVTKIDILPDDVFLEIFYLCRVDESGRLIYPTWNWHRLAQVCRRWRYIISTPSRFEASLYVWETCLGEPRLQVCLSYRYRLRFYMYSQPRQVSYSRRRTKHHCRFRGALVVYSISILTLRTHCRYCRP